MKHLTQQAVVLQKKMNEIYTGKSKSATLPPIQIQAPSMTSVLDMLNIINGILFVQISPRDIENFKVEFEKRQQSTTENDEDQPSSPSSEDATTSSSLKEIEGVADEAEATPPPLKEVTPPLKEATPSPLKEVTPHSEVTSPFEEVTPPPKEATPSPLKEATPTLEAANTESTEVSS